MGFSERHGFTAPRDAIQLDGADDQLRMALWNCTYIWLYEAPSRAADMGNWRRHELVELSARRIWMHELHRSAESFTVANFKKVAELAIISGPFNRMYDLIEAIVEEFRREPEFAELELSYNKSLERRRSGYRFIDGVLTDISNPDEVSAIEDVLGADEVSDGAKSHLRKSLSMLSDRDSPDYANSIKEAISAVEATASDLAPGKPTLGPMLEEIKRSYGLHPALVEGWKKLYGSSSDQPGVRHGSVQVSEADPDLARYYVVMCSAMVGYLTALRASTTFGGE
ncbi:AbiJ-NTD4 domain-containing protein [Gordonia sp. GN26]